MPHVTSCAVSYQTRSKLNISLSAAERFYPLSFTWNRARGPACLQTPLSTVSPLPQRSEKCKGWSLETSPCRVQIVKNGKRWFSSTQHPFCQKTHPLYSSLPTIMYSHLFREISTWVTFCLYVTLSQYISSKYIYEHWKVWGQIP